MNRRYFLSTIAAAAAKPRRAVAANDKLTIVCVGVRGRAGHLLRGFLDLPDVDVAMLCDIDSRLLPAAARLVEEKKGKAPRTTGDFRRALDDKSIDAIVVGTPDHWHAIPTVLACQAGKHVYVEKPCSHNVREGQVMLAAARKHNRVVQVGIQSRSGRHFAEAYEYIRSGALGKVVLARGWEASKQKTTGRPADTVVPEGVDYDMWLGPAPKRPFNPNRFHSTWRWFFDYGTGDLGNDGVHRTDYARRGLEAAFTGMGRTLPEWPTAVTSTGGKLYFDDDQEFPDTLMTTWEYPSAMLTYEMRIWSPTPLEGEAEGAAIYGDNGSVVIGNQGWRAYDAKGKLLPNGTQSGNDQADPAHKRNFVDCIRNNSTPVCDIAIGHVASSLTHMGNIAWRVGRRLRFDAATQTFMNDAEANRLLTRTYRAPWVLPKV